MTKSLALAGNVSDHSLSGLSAQEKVDKAGAGDLHFFHEWRGCQCINQAVGDGTRALAQGLGQCHGQIGGKIAVLGRLGPLQLDRQLCAFNIQAFCGLRQ